MKKTVTLFGTMVLGFALAASAAQSTTPGLGDIAKDKTALATDRQDVATDKADLKADRAGGDKVDTAKDKADLKTEPYRESRSACLLTQATAAC